MTILLLMGLAVLFGLAGLLLVVTQLRREQRQSTEQGVPVEPEPPTEVERP